MQGVTPDEHEQGACLQDTARAGPAVPDGDGLQRHVFGKLGVTSRVLLARMAAERAAYDLAPSPG